MKRALSLILTLLLVLALTACGSLGGVLDGGLGGLLGGGSGSSSEGSSSGDSSGGGSAGSDIYAEDGYGEGRIGDVIHSIFMDFSVNSAYTTSNYNGYTAPAGMKVLVVEMTIKNTFNESLPMWADDFQAQWTTSAETGEYSWPITEAADGGGMEVLADEQLPAYYELAVNESRTGVLAFDVPENEKDFSISHLELFDDGSEGDTFFIYFTAEAK